MTPMIRQCLSLLVSLSCLTLPMYGQYLVSAESLGIRTIAQLEAELGQTVRTGVSLYKIRYMTTGIHGAPDTASGLLVYPEASLSPTRPMVVYQHGTTNGPSDAPSRLASGSDEALGYGSMGYITLAPDYLGLGDNDGFHPYVHAASEASAGLDMLFAVTEWVEMATGEAWVGELFVSGYSQGGHAAAALQKELEENWGLVYPVTASTPMSGPYSISGVMFNRIISEEVYFLPAYIAYVTLAYQEAYGNLYNDLSEVFKPAYVPIIQNFRNGTLTTSDMNFQLISQIFAETPLIKPKVMFIDTTLHSIIANENHPFRVALRDNDLYDWAPQAPTRLYYCTADEQVPYQNSIKADSAMQANGAPDVMAISFGALTHGGCAPLAINASIDFFDSFILPSGVNALQQAVTSVFLSPNPAGASVSVLPEYHHQITELSITAMTGNIVHHIREVQADNIDVSFLQAGLYIVYAKVGEQYLRQKLLIIN